MGTCPIEFGGTFGCVPGFVTGCLACMFGATCARCEEAGLLVAFGICGILGLSSLC